MTSLSAQHNASWRSRDARRLELVSTYGNGLIASVTLLMSLLSIGLFWPVEYVGYDTGSGDHQIRAIVAGSAAERAGLAVGDRILMLYGRPIDEVVMSIRAVDAIGSRPVPITVERNGQRITLSIPRQPPAPAFQATKLALFALALVCWCTGYVLGFVRKHTVIGSMWVVTFWLCMGGVIGSLMFTRYVAYPVYTGLLWFTVAVLAPLGLYVHLWFPPRSSAIQSPRRIAAYLLAGVLTLNSALLLWSAFAHPSLEEVINLLTLVAPLAVLGSLIGSGMLLLRGYNATPVAHVRRQIRLIMLACIGVPVSWILAFSIPFLVPGVFIHGNWLILLVGAVPLAYLIGGWSRDLYRLDHVATRGLAHLTVTTCLGIILILGSRGLGLSASATGFVVAAAFVATYRPVHRVALRLLPFSLGAHNAKDLDQVFQRLTTTLDASVLTTTLLDGVQANFGRPPLAFFIGDLDGTNSLRLVKQDRLSDIPEVLSPGALITALCSGTYVIDSRTVQYKVGGSTLSLSEQLLVLNPDIELWCVLRHARGHLLGLLLLGMRADLDPYRSDDQIALRRLLEAASLAFGNSAAYTQQQENEEQIRELYQQLQQAQDDAASELARWLHDEIINIPIRDNMQALRELLRQLQDPIARERISAILQREQELVFMLRGMSEQLHPLGIDDPFGLPIFLSREVERQDQMWRGQCTLEVIGKPVRTALKVQYEAFRIVREAITNAIKHANATIIRVQLCYPESSSSLIRLTISDDGRNAGSMASTGSHRGLRYMRESARIAGGDLSIVVQPHVSTTIEFAFPADHDAPNSEEQR